MGVKYSDDALAGLFRLSKSLQTRITKKMLFFASCKNPRALAKHLTGTCVYRFRIGDYRVICDIEGDVITVLFIDKRDNVYKKL